MTTPDGTLLNLAEAIHDATGYTGPLLSQATYVAASLFAEIMGDDKANRYFAERAAECGEQFPRQTAEVASNHRPGWNFGNLSLD